MTRRLLPLSLAVGLSLLAVSAYAADTVWPSLRGGASGRGACKFRADGSAPELREWSFKSGAKRRYRPGLAVWASPALAVVRGRPMAFIGGYDQRLHAFDLASRAEQWQLITNGVIASAPAVGLVDGEALVCWGSADRSVRARTAAEGRRVWTRELVRATTTLGEVTISAPLLHDGVLYIATFAYDKALARNSQRALLHGLDMRTGRSRWPPVLISNGPVSSPVGRGIGGRFLVFVAARKGLLQAFDASNGRRPTREWKFQMPHEVLGSPVVEEGTDAPLLFLGSKFGNLIAIDARTGRERWQRMAGNWIDNTACVGDLDGERVVFTGSHDYRVYAFRARDGEDLWSRHLGGEVYTAPCFFESGHGPRVAVACLDDHLYVLDARDGSVETSYFTGRPIWDKVAKGETLWGSPAALEAGDQTVLVHGSFNDTVYVLPLFDRPGHRCRLRAKVHSSAGLWQGLGLVFVLFMSVVVPVVLRLPARGKASGGKDAPGKNRE